MTRSEPVALGSKHWEIKRLRTLLRDSSARAAESAFVLEGPRIVEDALGRGAVFDAIFLGPNARTAFRDLLELAAVDDVPVFDLKEGVLEKLGSTRTPQPVLAVATIPPRPAIATGTDAAYSADARTWTINYVANLAPTITSAIVGVPVTV